MRVFSFVFCLIGSGSPALDFVVNGSNCFMLDYNWFYSEELKFIVLLNVNPTFWLNILSFGQIPTFLIQYKYVKTQMIVLSSLGAGKPWWSREASWWPKSFLKGEADPFYYLLLKLQRKACHHALVPEAWNEFGGLIYLWSQQVLNLILYWKYTWEFGIGGSSEEK